MEPTVAAYPFSWLIMVPFLLLIERIPSIAKLAGILLWSGILGVAGIYPWLVEAMNHFFTKPIWTLSLIFLFFCTILALQFVLFGVIVAILKKTLPNVWLLAAPIVYTIVENLNPSVMTMGFYLPFCNRGLALLQPASLLGASGVTFLLTTSSTGLFLLYQGVVSKNDRLKKIGATVFLSFLLVHLGLGLLLFHRSANDPPPQTNIAVIQPMSPLKILNSEPDKRTEAAQSLLQLMNDASSQSKEPLDLIIWPEGAAAFSLRADKYNPEYIQAIQEFRTQHSTPILVQDIEFIRLPDSEKLRYYATATLLDQNDDISQTYRKSKLMPFTEYLPAENTFPFLRKLIPGARSILAGESPAPLEGPGGKFLPVICFETLFPEYIRASVTPDTGYLVNLTNDRWYGERQQPWQHLAYARLRSVEVGKPTVRATNSGVSAFIDEHGVIQARIDVGEKTALLHQIVPASGQTFYGRHGEIFCRLVLPLALLGVLLTGFLRRRKTVDNISE